MKAMVEGSGAWIGTNQVPRKGVGRGRLIKPKEFSSGYGESPGCQVAARAGRILGAAKYPVKNND
jgi:hypothetical protein